MLSIKSPTPTTVLYTVSTRPPISTFSARARNILLWLLRILAGVLVGLILVLELQNTSLTLGTSTLSKLGTAALTSPAGRLASLITSSFNGAWRVLICAGTTWLIFRKGYVEESVLVIRGLGVQTSTSSASYLWASSTRFIPTSSIQDLFIHEAFKGSQVRYYLSIVVEGEGDVVVVFPNILPSLQILKQVWRGARACLYETHAG